MHGIHEEDDRSGFCGRIRPPSRYGQEREGREEKRYENEAANSDSQFVFTMDLQQVQCLPKTNAGAQYYERKLQVHNMTFFNKKTKDGFNYVWDETQGELDGAVFGFIISKFIRDIVKVQPYSNADTIILWSDNCTHQNKNCMVSNALISTARSTKVNVIQKYLTKGHTMMECDSMHSTIERRTRNLRAGERKIFVPAQLSVAIQAARIQPKPYHVEILNHTRRTTTVRCLVAISYETVLDAKRVRGNKVMYKLKFTIGATCPLGEGLART